jgi:hypothetical protein
MQQQGTGRHHYSVASLQRSERLAYIIIQVCSNCFIVEGKRSNFKLTLPRLLPNAIEASFSAILVLTLKEREVLQAQALFFWKNLDNLDFACDLEKSLNPFALYIYCFDQVSSS